MLLAHLLLNAVSTQVGDRPADVHPRFIDRITEPRASVAEYDKAAGLRHERARMAHRSADDDVGALQRDATPRSRIAADYNSPPCAVAPAACPARPATSTLPDIMFSATPTPTVPWTRTVASWFMPAQ